jgi:hypothetical protein
VTDLETTLREGLGEVAELVAVPDNAWATYRSRRRPRQVRRRLRLGLSTAGIAAATAGIVIGAIALSSSNAGSGNTLATTGRTVSLVPTHHVSAQQLQESASVLARRLAAENVQARVHVVDVGASPHLTVKVPARSLGAVTAVAGSRGVLRFRRALSMEPGSPAGASSERGTAQLAFSRTLTSAFTSSFASWDCANHRNPSYGDDPAADYLIACSTDGSVKYLLAPTAVKGSQVSSAAADLDAISGTQWVVDLGFTRSGSSAWRQVTKTAYDVNQGRAQSTNCSPPTGCNAVAIVLDGVVQSAPYISQQGGIAGGRAQISGNFTQKSATDLANILKYGALPTTFRLAH